MSNLTTHKGGCHCGDIRFEFDVDPEQPVGRCNCTVCTMRGSSGAKVRPGDFRLLTPEDRLGSYSFGTRSGTYYFCKNCGINTFGRVELEAIGGAFVFVNMNCVDGIDPATLKAIYWDGRHDNWMAGPRDTPWPVHA